MRKPARIALVALGLALAVYGAASLTGMWLGEPPWWVAEIGSRNYRWEHGRFSGDRLPELHPLRKAISAGVVVAGLALAAFAAWPRRARDGTPARAATGRGVV